MTHVNFKGFLFTLGLPPPPAAAVGSQLHVDLPKCAFRFVYKPPSSLLPAALCTLTAPDFVFGERDHLKCPVQPTAAALGSSHSSAQKRGKGRGLGAPLCGAPPVVFCSLCPLTMVQARWLQLLSESCFEVRLWAKPNTCCMLRLQTHGTYMHRYRQMEV